MKQNIQIGKKVYSTDFGFLFILFVFFLTSCFALFNAFNLIRNNAGESYLRRQILWYVVGFTVMYIISKIPMKKIMDVLPTVYKILLGLLVYLLASRMLDRFTGHTLPFAHDVNGAYSWLVLPGLGSFQASEFMKVVLILKTSQIITDFQKTHPDPSYKDDLMMFLEIFKWALLPMILILLEPDTGVFIIIAFTLLVLLLCSGIRRLYIWLSLGFVALVLGGFFFVYFTNPDLLSSIFSAYQIRRIDAWLYPERNVLGSSNQLYTALLSLGSAGLGGHGMQASIIAIPEAHTDFIFAAFGQCFGLAGTSFILLVCMCLDLYLCKMAYNSKSPFPRLVMVGSIAMLLYQQIQNLGMIVGLVPITGITLPLISYGGSSILSYFILFGIILNMSPVSKRTFRFRRYSLKAIYAGAKEKVTHFFAPDDEESSSHENRFDWHRLIPWLSSSSEETSVENSGPIHWNLETDLIELDDPHAAKEAEQTSSETEEKSGQSEDHPEDEQNDKNSSSSAETVDLELGEKTILVSPSNTEDKQNSEKNPESDAADSDQSENSEESHPLADIHEGRTILHLRRHRKRFSPSAEHSDETQNSALNEEAADDSSANSNGSKSESTDSTVSRVAVLGTDASDPVSQKFSEFMNSDDDDPDSLFHM